VLSSSSHKTHSRVPENLLALLERLESFPAAQSDLKSWWVEELQAKPTRPKTAQTGSEPDDSDNEPDATEDDWRKFFDEDEKQEKQKKPSEPSVRLHQLTVHQSLHSLASHRAVFTRLWLRLLPRLSGDERTGSALSLRALNIMHHGVMPHLTRAVLVMDWVGGCVDYGKCLIFLSNYLIGCTCTGGVVGLLALNTLFVLMQEYNLSVTNRHRLILAIYCAIGTIRRSTPACTPSSTRTFYTSNTEADLSASQSCF
jgi:U3 small nucleolar RNA-associated protein 19